MVPEGKGKGHLEPYQFLWAVAVEVTRMTSKTLLLLGPDGFVLEPDLRSLLHELLSVGAQSTTWISFGPDPTLQLFVLI